MTFLNGSVTSGHWDIRSRFMSQFLVAQILISTQDAVEEENFHSGHDQEDYAETDSDSEDRVRTRLIIFFFFAHISSSGSSADEKFDRIDDGANDGQYLKKFCF
jgi:hypothetical protein